MVTGDEAVNVTTWNSNKAEIGFSRSSNGELLNRYRIGLQDGVIIIQPLLR